MDRPSLYELYQLLYRHYGSQGWWPLKSLAGRRGYDDRGYHPGDYRPPGTRAQRFEVALGAVLTQNTSWLNVERAMANLLAAKLCSPQRLLALTAAELAALIRPSGYFNQKAKKLRHLAAVLQNNIHPSRKMLLAVWGIGPETADSILLYAYHSLYFVIDAYTRRLLTRLGLNGGGESYPELQARFHQELPRSLKVYSEYHALIVRHAKELCRTHPHCAACPLARQHCPFGAAELRGEGGRVGIR